MKEVNIHEQLVELSDDELIGIIMELNYREQKEEELNDTEQQQEELNVTEQHRVEEELNDTEQEDVVEEEEEEEEGVMSHMLNTLNVRG